MRKTVKVEELSGGANTAKKIEEEINAQMEKGWTYHSAITKGGSIYLIFGRTLAQ